MMSTPNSKTQSFRVAFVLDERLPHDRKQVFTRMVSMMKSKFDFEILSSSMTEDDLLKELEKGHYGLVMLPWYHYISWKKVEAFFGSLRMQGATVAGYFADSLLPFEFANFPNYHRFILLDFYRFEQNEIEWILQSLIVPQRRSGFSGLFARNTSVYYADWYDDETTPTRSIDTFMKHPLLQSGTWNHRLSSLRFYMTALWSLAFEDRHTLPSNSAAATLEVAEVNRRLVIKLLFESTELTLHSMMKHLQPNASEQHTALRELYRHCDFLRIHHFPETQQIEVTAFFIPTAPAMNFPNELRGWWIEPLVKKFVKSPEEEKFEKRQEIAAQNVAEIGDNLHQAIEVLRNALLQLSTLAPEDRVAYENLVVNIRFLIQEIDKKVILKKAS